MNESSEQVPLSLIAPSSYSAHDCVIVVLEGQHDIEFLRRLSQRLHAEVSSLPDLAEIERHGQLIFLPVCGGDVSAWATRLAPLGLPEFHVYDRELSPETELRRKVVEQINQRPGCYATLTNKRALENYLHPLAIDAATGITLEMDDDTSVVEQFAQQRFAILNPERLWADLTLRARRRLANHAKRALNVKAVQSMTCALLVERDPAGEVLGWLEVICRMATANRPEGQND